MVDTKPKRLLVELEDREPSNTPHYLEQLGEELGKLKLEVISIKEVDLSVETGDKES